MVIFTPGLGLARAFDAERSSGSSMSRARPACSARARKVLGYDTPRSVDHQWRSRVQLFVDADQVDHVRNALAHGLSPDYRGWPAAWYSLAHHAVTHHIEVTTFGEWIVDQLGLGPRRELDEATWLGLSQQRLLQITRGGVFRDDAGGQTRVRSLLAWYPTGCVALAAGQQWRLIGATEPLLERTLELGDRRCARLPTARRCRLIMRMAFLQERRYRPYGKRQGTAFARAWRRRELGPPLDQALNQASPATPGSPLSRALLALGRAHSELSISGPRAGPFKCAPAKPSLASATIRRRRRGHCARSKRSTRLAGAFSLPEWDPVPRSGTFELGYPTPTSTTRRRPERSRGEE